MTMSAQKQRFDRVSFMPPKGWKKESSHEAVVFSINETKKKSWGVIKLVKSVASTGDVEKDFQSAWTLLSATPFSISLPPVTTDILEEDGWKIMSGTYRRVVLGISLFYRTTGNRLSFIFPETFSA